MGLHNNGCREWGGVFRYAGLTASNGTVFPSLTINTSQTGALRNFRAGEAGVSDKSSFPAGARHPLAWQMPQKAGGLACNNSAGFTITTTGSGVYGRNLSTSLSLDMAISQAALALVVGGVTSISFSLTVPNPAIVGVLQAATNIPGLNFTMTPTLGAKSGLGTEITMTFTQTGTATAKGFMAVNISGEGEAVTPATVANAVWEAFAVAHDNPGTMGEAMNAAGSAADPWLTTLPGAYLAGTAGQIIGTLQNDINLHTDSAVAEQQALLELSSFDSHVHVDSVNGSPGTAYPLGTFDHPVDTMMDALTIAYNKGFNQISVKNPLTILASDNITDTIITSDSWPEIMVNSGVAMENSIFQQVSLYGEFDGLWSTLVNCWTYTITNFCGWVRGGSISDVTLAPGSGLPEEGVSFFDDLVPLFPGVPASVTMNTDTDVSFTGCSDHIILKGMTAGSIATVGLRGGILTVDASCTGGTISASGTGSVINNSALTVDVSGLATTVDALNASPVGVNAVEMNGTEIIGNGTSANKWRGAGEPA